MESFTSTTRSTSSNVLSAVNAISWVVISIILSSSRKDPHSPQPPANRGPPGATRDVRRIPGVYYSAPAGPRLASGETRNFEEVRVGVGRSRYGGNHVVGARPRGVHSRRREKKYK